VISEGSCDTEDWSNDAGKQMIYTGIIFHNITGFVFLFFDQINAVLVSRRDSFKSIQNGSTHTHTHV